MANEEHLKILKRGVEAWNQWRHANPTIQLDLSEANLSQANLSGADLRVADLRVADLSGAHLSRADLRGANLSGANLRGAHLGGADLSETDLSWANLSWADLSRAFLRDANLRVAYLGGADLSGADLSGAIVVATEFGNVDLSVVKGLDRVVHAGPSSVGIDTVYKSKGKIPEAFLRGCGVPDTMITYIQSLVGQPIQYYSCFISYSSKDQECAERLHADLQAKGVRVWIAPEDLKWGAKIRVGIDESIRKHDKLLLVLSQESVASDWVEQEVETALARERDEKRLVLFPIRLDNTVMNIHTGWPALIKNTRNIGDFRAWKDHDAYQKAFDRLLRDLKAESAEATE